MPLAKLTQTKMNDPGSAKIGADKNKVINRINFEKSFNKFLQDFKEAPKYVGFATEMMKKGHNMFRFDLADIEKFNQNLSKFVDSSYQQSIHFKLGFRRM